MMFVTNCGSIVHESAPGQVQYCCLCCNAWCLPAFSLRNPEAGGNAVDAVLCWFDCLSAHTHVDAA